MLPHERVVGPERFDSVFGRFIAARSTNTRNLRPSSTRWTATRARAFHVGGAADTRNGLEIDPAVAGIQRAQNGTTLVRVEARDKLVMPVTLRVTRAGGRMRNVRRPADMGFRQPSTTIAVPAGQVVEAGLEPITNCPTETAPTTSCRASFAPAQPGPRSRRSRAPRSRHAGGATRSGLRSAAGSVRGHRRSDASHR